MSGDIILAYNLKLFNYHYTIFQEHTSRRYIVKMEEKTHKLGLAINAFEGTEHIYNIVSEIRDLVDYVVIGLQDKSYLGDPIDEADRQEAIRLRDEDHLVDDIIVIHTDPKEFSRVQETFKRNTLVDTLKDHGCTHQLIIDSDEYYTHNAFKRARDYIYENDVEVSYCRYFNYFGSGAVDDYKTYLVYPFHEGNFVPFIAKIGYKFEWQGKDFPKPSDPTRRYVRPKVYKKDKDGNIIYKDKKNKKDPIVDHYLVDYHEFKWNELKMHHFSWVRNDIRKKMRDWSSRVYFHDWYELVDRAAKRFEDFCNGDKEGKAILLFNTPDNKVELCNMDKQYVFPKVDIHERTLQVRDESRSVSMLNASKRDWRDIAIAYLKNQKKDWFLLCEDMSCAKESIERARDIVASTSDDTKVYSFSWDKKIVGLESVLVPSRAVMVSKSTMLRILSVDASLLELNGVCSPLEIVSLSMRRYYWNIDMDYRDNLEIF